MAGEPWYQEGLRFRCTRCGRCCRGPGNVWIDDGEIRALADHLGLPEDEFRRSHVRRTPRGATLRHKRNQDCIFWSEDTGCGVYALRPRQCRSYPFWRANLLSRESWDDESRSCPGIGDGPLHPAEEIERRSADDGIPAHRTRRKAGIG